MNRRKKDSHIRPHLIVLALVTLVVTGLIARVGTMSGTEQAVFYRFYDLSTNLRLLMLALTLTGSTWMIIVLTCVLFASRKRLPALYVLITGLITVLATECIKVIVARPRPFELLTDVTSRERFVVGMGFPSGHTAVTTAVAIVLSAHIPKRWRALLVLWVVAVGLSRMYLGVHAPLDVIGGIAVGIIVGFGLQEIWPRLSRALK